MRELNFQEQAFMALYLTNFSAPESARLAGYSESVARAHAWSWVGVTGCPPNKLHLRDAIHDEMTKRLQIECVDAEWVLRRAKLIADFNIKRFITVTDAGDAVYDFTEATDDDWYCIDEYVTEQSYRGMKGFEVPVDKLKIKTAGRLAALKLVGDHVKVQAFKENVEHSGTVTQINMTSDDYKQARAEAMAQDDC